MKINFTFIFQNFRDSLFKVTLQNNSNSKKKYKNLDKLQYISLNMILASFNILTKRKVSRNFNF